HPSVRRQPVGNRSAGDPGSDHQEVGAFGRPDDRLAHDINPSKAMQSTRSSTATDCWSWWSTTRQFASDIERSTPDPWLPALRTLIVPSGSHCSQARWYSVRPGRLRKADW